MKDLKRNEDFDPISTSVKEYFQINKEYKRLEETRKLINKEIKNFLDNTPGKYSIGAYNVTLAEQDKSKFDEDKLIELLKKKGLGNCLKIQIVYDEDEIENSLYKGLLTQEELDACIVPNKILALYVREK